MPLAGGMFRRKRVPSTSLVNPFPKPESLSMRLLSLSFLALAMLTPQSLMAAGGHGSLVAVDRAVLTVPQLSELRLPVYHAFHDALLVRVTETDLSLLDRYRVKYTIVAGDPERETLWLLSRRKNPGLREQQVESAIVYRSGDALVVNSIPSAISANVSAVRLRQSAWDLASLRLEHAGAAPNAGNDSLVAAITSTVNPDTIRWFIQSLQDFGTRYARAGNRDSVAGWIRDQFLRMGYAGASFEGFTYDGLGQNNVVAVLPAADPSAETIVVGAHHDAITSSNPMVSAPGADDNASGTAAVLEIARVLMLAGYQPEASIRFTTFAAEEVGLVGSSVAASASRQTGLPIRLMVNHDMISHTLAATGASSVDLNYYDGAVRYRDLAWQSVLDFSLLTPRVGTRNSGGSDSYTYWREGFPAIYFEEREFSPYYHSPNDIVTNVSVDYCAEIIRASCATVLRASLMPGTVRTLVVRDRGDGTSLLLFWSGVRDADLAGYRVTVSDGQRDTSIFTPDTTLVIQNLRTGVPITAVVVAEDVDGNTGSSAEATGTPNLAPVAPAGVAATPAWHRVVLQWERNLELDLLGYSVYRSDVVGSTGVALTALPTPDTVYVDSTATGGTYYYYSVRAVDSTHSEGAASATIRSRVVSLDGGILLVDETADGANPPRSAPDSLHDAFYRRLLSAFTADQFDVGQEGGIDLAVMGAYSTLVWYGDDISNFAYASAARQEIARYLEYGGRFLYAGFRPSRPFSDATAFTADFVPGDFFYDYMRVRRTEFSFQPPGMSAALAAAPGYADVRVDPLKTPPVANGTLRSIEAIFPAEGGLEIYTFDSVLDTTGILKGKPVGVQSLGQPYHTVVLSFPLAYMVEEDARALVHHVLTDLFTEPTAIDGAQADIPSSFALSQNYPNPFNPSTTLRFDLPGESEVTLTVYDLLGRELEVLFRASAPAGRHEVLWNASGRASGVYFVRMDARPGGGAPVFSATRKVLLLQ